MVFLYHFQTSESYSFSFRFLSLQWPQTHQSFNGVGKLLLVLRQPNVACPLKSSCKCNKRGPSESLTSTRS